MSELADFLLARIAESDAARENSVYYSMPHPVTGERIQWGTDEEVAEVRRSAWWRRSAAECAAHRDLVEGLDGASIPGTAFARRNPSLPTLAREWLQLLAAPYADHPDYRSEWKP